MLLRGCWWRWILVCAWLLLLRVVCLVKSNILFQNMTAYKPDPAKLQGFLHTFLKHTPISRCFVKPQHCMRPVRNPFTKNKLFHCIYREKTQAVKNNSPHQLSKRSHFNTGYCKTPPPQHTIPDRRLNFFCNWIGSLAVRVKSSA